MKTQIIKDLLILLFTYMFIGPTVSEAAPSPALFSQVVKNLLDKDLMIKETMDEAEDLQPEQNLFSFFPLVAFGIIALGYFVPTVVANIRHKKNKAAITVLNIFGGWTVLGWVVALVWAFMED
jgi:hypothetical protein